MMIVPTNLSACKRLCFIARARVSVCGWDKKKTMSNRHAVDEWTIFFLISSFFSLASIIATVNIFKERIF